jgi:hypothetical protein
MTKQATARPTLRRPWRSARIATLLLLAGVFTDRLVFSGQSAEVDKYHQRVRAAAEAVPYYVGSWLGRESPVPQGAITLLKPNAIVSRSYSDMDSGAGFSFLIVHCRDARDMLGHFPPVCYRGQGWSMKSATPRDWKGGRIQGTQYVFEIERGGYSSRIVVNNFMVLSNGRTARDMDDIEAAARDSRLKHFGAAQIQFVYSEELSESMQDEISSAFIDELNPLISTITQFSQEEGK